MSDSRFSAIGPGLMDMCNTCIAQHQREVEHLIADELEKQIPILNGCEYLKDLLKIRRDQHRQQTGAA